MQQLEEISGFGSSDSLSSVENIAEENQSFKLPENVIE